MNRKHFLFLRNRRVNFRISDIHIPSPDTVLKDLHGNSVVDGKVVDLTYGRDQENAYVVVQVEGVKNFIIVPVEKVNTMPIVDLPPDEYE